MDPALYQDVAAEIKKPLASKGFNNK